MIQAELNKGPVCERGGKSGDRERKKAKGGRGRGSRGRRGDGRESKKLVSLCILFTPSSYRNFLAFFKRFLHLGMQFLFCRDLVISFFLLLNRKAIVAARLHSYTTIHLYKRKRFLIRSFSFQHPLTNNNNNNTEIFYSCTQSSFSFMTFQTFSFLTKDFHLFFFRDYF